ncbi:hypothetical protein NCAS_0A00330 [Naumovozyma castellii]|uniref:PDZ GRASP-type domain-containing protein n=1 Tax=Naumovozyma castellii TaxID=27288 RepID=G0V557_NAUCA|nr:hypothetical protein NCAS_0A00330 [Naumovozyma castellii CBS 4309]CCC66593.1 hypothetical protein NCAS_0A00330 [Naumovozyma castellii CBS 4309]
MFRIAKSFVRTIEQSVQDTLALSNDQNQLDAFFQCIPPNLIYNQLTPTSTDNGLSASINSSLAGLRVVWVDELQLQLNSFFDYIVGLNDDPLPLTTNQHGFSYPDYNAIYKLLNDISITAQQGHSPMVKLNIWSAKGGTFRDEYITLTPKDETHLDEISLNNTNTAQQNTFQPLGFKVQWTPLIGATYTYHILNLNIPGGPAQLAGLIPDEDYIVNCQDGLLSTGGETLLQDIVRTRANHDLILYVYNKVSDCVRPITVHIGPDGRLGCGVGYGFLHRIPTVKQQQQQMSSSLPPPIDSADSFIPSQQLHTTPAPPPSAHRKKKVATAVDDPNMLEYFNEGKDKFTRPPTTTESDGASAVPPPPIIHKEKESEQE